MARRPNYGFEKRQKEIEKQKKKDEKAEKKRLRQEEGGGPDENGIDWGAAEELGVAREIPEEGGDGEARG
ncbi:MAG TPA: hypothetical protein VGR37_02845 [Longimicrobiaceae bacterium]|nr:hypothetical protein [Longimicrobiaceae bacterium]